MKSQYRASVRLYISFMCRVLLIYVILQTPIANAENAPPAHYSAPFSYGSYLTSREALTSFAVLGFGLLMAIVSTYLLQVAKVAATEVIRLVALLVIVTGVLFLVAAGYAVENIAPALGLLGTVAGYLLGRSEKKDTSKTD
ncbi:hypothetical protein C8R32_10266 [Nitrosospira sp. Nsp5]|uniref:Uncharacterized protein n=1 Tax=Nitrosospira multiformis TaxID=1231 RepID=A0ABY0TL47_9PROT|nr:hypothetical protein C8R32_10266 [Nitrosospira sp. Nsp5]SDR00020.1 hypothetical protein SAMN05216402_3192 [Nitrosospira multiformis]